MSVVCESKECTYCKNGRCCLDQIRIMDGQCVGYEDYTDSEDYQSLFYKNVVSGTDHKQYRLASYGKKYEFYGFVFYTQDDDRDGLKKCMFTEEISGYSIPGYLLLDPKAKDEVVLKISDTIRYNVPVRERIDIKDLVFP